MPGALLNLFCFRSSITDNHAQAVATDKMITNNNTPSYHMVNMIHTLTTHPISLRAANGQHSHPNS